jgi:putative nucleotidyltransferase with HDIG domain
VRELGFQEFPRPARILVAGLCFAGLLAFVLSLHDPPRDVTAGFLYAVFAFLASSQRLRMHPRVGTMSLGFLFVLAALFQCGTATGIGAAILGAAGGALLTNVEGKRQPLISTCYAAGTLAIAAWAGGGVLDELRPTGASLLDLARALLPCGAAVSVYYGVSVASVVGISYVAGRGLPKRWLVEAAWMCPVYYAGGAAALVIGAAYHHFGPAIFVLGLPIIYVFQRSYAVRAEQAAEQLQHLEERTRSSEALANLYMSVVEALSAAIEAKDQGTRLHVRRVQSLARAVGRRVGLEGADLQAAETAAVLHDIGKLAVPDHILSKPSRLTDSEYRMVRAHPEVGEAILRPIDFGVEVGPIVRHHHERVDGSGYPDGLAGEQIPMGARILGVIDVYDALVSDRPYRKAWRSERATEYLREHAGSAFDPRVVEALVEVLATAEDETPGEGACEALPIPAEPEELVAAQEDAVEKLTEELAAQRPVHTCVVYRVDERNAETEAVAAAGQYADCFARLRAPLGTGPSGMAARLGRLITAPNGVEDLGHLPGRPPAGLEASSVTAVPAMSPSGRLSAVVSLYSHPGAEVPDSLLAEAAVKAAEAGRRLDQNGTRNASEEQAALLEYAAFLVALNRDVARAREAGDRVTVMAAEIEAPDAETRRRLLLSLAEELRLCARGQARVIEREAAGEIVAMFPPVIEAAARACVQGFERAAREEPNGEGIAITVGSAVFPEDAESGHGLISVAETRVTRSRRKSAPKPVLEMALPA